MKLTLREARARQRSSTDPDDPTFATDEQVRQRAQVLGVEVVEEHPAFRLERERIEAEDTAAGEPHGLDHIEVRYCRENGLDVARYAALKEARSIDDYREIGR